VRGGLGGNSCLLRRLLSSPSRRELTRNRLGKIDSNKAEPVSACYRRKHRRCAKSYHTLKNDSDIRTELEAKMTLQNRVDPFGHFHAVPARGDLMGNRGILHDDQKHVRKTHAHQNWVTCSLSFKGRKRLVMGPGTYTELFFLDEATAFAAGHRPCATCRRDRYLEFIRIWEAVHGGPKEDRTVPQTVDRMLHKSRITRREKVTYEADCMVGTGSSRSLAAACMLLTMAAVLSISVPSQSNTIKSKFFFDIFSGLIHPLP